MRYLILKIIFISFSLSVNAQFSQPGELDTTFNFGRPHGFFSDPANPEPGEGTNSAIISLTLQPDGKVLIGGTFEIYNGMRRNRIARLNTDSSLDTTFNPGTGANDWVRYFFLQPDGKVLIGGDFTGYTSTSRNRIARLNADGSLDTTFNPGTGANSSVQSLALQPDGKVLIGGDFPGYNGTPCNYIARLNADGSLDTTFNPGTGANSSVQSLALQPNGKVLIGGLFTSYNGTPCNYIARLNADGRLDTSFNPGTGANSSIWYLALQPNGKVLTGGDFTSYNGTSRNRIARLNADGSLDTTFNPGTGANSSVTTLALQPDGKVLIGGFFTSYNGTPCNYIARLNADGSLDTTFNIGTGADGTVHSLALQPDGRVLIGGGFTSYNSIGCNRIARLNADGSLDATFNPGIGANSRIGPLALQPDGKVLIGGWLTSYNGMPRNCIARLNADARTDTTFNPGTGANSFVHSFALQPDGKVLIGGSFSSYNDIPSYRIARLNTNGSLDTTFKPGTGTDFFVLSLALQPDGKVLIGGDFTSYNGTPCNYIARLNADGSLDTTFNPGTGANSSIWPLAIQPNGKVLIGGNFTIYNGTPRNYIARLNADGSLDTTFNPGTGVGGVQFQEVRSVALQPDGKVLIGGFFTSYNGTPRNSIARLNADGSLDTTFNPGTGTYVVNSFALQPDGKVLIGGFFASYNDTPRYCIARLNADGSIDTTFNPGTGTNGAVNSLALQPDGSKVLIVGDFTIYNGFYRPRIARILTESISVGIPDEFEIKTSFHLFPNPFIHQFHIVAPQPFHYQIFSIEGRAFENGYSPNPELSLSTSAWPSGTYILRIITEEGVSVRKLVKE
jgi:uncharacterized delta-60 repeat protein